MLDIASAKVRVRLSASEGVGRIVDTTRNLRHRRSGRYRPIQAARASRPPPSGDHLARGREGNDTEGRDQTPSVMRAEQTADDRGALPSNHQGA
jgi:hypothetical protein